VTYNDPDTNNRRNGVGQPRTNKSWLIGGIAVLAALFVIFTVYRHGGNNPSPMNTPAISTTAPDSGTTGTAVPTTPTSR
jgi:hypothetical protein